jgi:hypothetical protein
MAIRFHLDEHVDPSIATGLRRRSIDVTTTAEAGLLGASDDAHLAFARRQRRVVFTQAQDFLRLGASGVEHAGMVYNQQGTRTIGQIIEFLELIDVCMTQEEMFGHIEFV